MHYILGTKFIVSEIQRGRSDAATLQKNRNRGMFPEAGEYEVYYIKRVSTESVEYTFYNLTNGNPHKILFSGTKAADDMIAAFKQESLPDYIDVYKSVTD